MPDAIPRDQPKKLPVARSAGTLTKPRINGTVGQPSARASHVFIRSRASLGTVCPIQAIKGVMLAKTSRYHRNHKWFIVK